MNLLHISSSLFSDSGKSTELSQNFIDLWQKTNPKSRVKVRDLAQHPVPHLDAATFQAAAVSSPARTTEQQAQAQLADELIEELHETDVLILSVPMYNFGIPSTLKAWIDHIARAGATFKYTENGPEGLLRGKTAYVMCARGGAYKDTPKDTQTPYLKTLLGFLGIEDVHFIFAEKLSMGSPGADDVMGNAKSEIEQLIG